MFQIKKALLGLAGMALIAATPAFAQSKSAGGSGSAPTIGGQMQAANPSANQMQPPPVNVPANAANQFERNPVLSLPEVFAHQWSPIHLFPPESLIDQRYLRTATQSTRELSLKQVIYIAIRNNPALKTVALDPVSATESVRLANAAFDPDLTSQLDVSKSVAPVGSPFQVQNSVAYTQKFYDWNFAVNKVLATSNGTLGITFDNNRTLSNSTFSSVNPSYTPTLEMSLVQPLLRNFGWDFATINVRLAESAQRTSQWNYGQSLQDFVQRVGNDYWAVVQAEENLQVAEAALKFNNDLVRVNRISLQVGTLAPLDLEEAQSAASTAQANVYAAEAALKTARIALREDAMLNPHGTFLPENIEPSEQPNPSLEITDTQVTALEKMIEYSPALAGLREAIRTSLLQVKYAQNQTMPQLNIGAQFGVSAVSGTTPCTPNIRSGTGAIGNCTPPGALLNTGNRLPFGGVYGDALNRMLNAQFYNYAAVLSFEMPLDNAASKAALAQARVAYEQARLQYRAALSQSVVNVESALANLRADAQRVRATHEAVYYAQQSLHDEQVRFRVGMATTHDLLQYQSQLVTAQGNEVQADIDLENARIALWHAEGTLLSVFDINFQVQNPHESPWYSRF